MYMPRAAAITTWAASRSPSASVYPTSRVARHASCKARSASSKRPNQARVSGSLVVANPSFWRSPEATAACDAARKLSTASSRSRRIHCVVASCTHASAHAACSPARFPSSMARSTPAARPRRVESPNTRLRGCCTPAPRHSGLRLRDRRQAVRAGRCRLALLRSARTGRREAARSSAAPMPPWRGSHRAPRSPHPRSDARRADPHSAATRCSRSASRNRAASVAPPTRSEASRDAS